MLYGILSWDTLKRGAVIVTVPKSYVLMYCTCWSNRAQNIGSGMYSTKTLSTILISWIRRFCEHANIQTDSFSCWNHRPFDFFMRHPQKRLSIKYKLLHGRGDTRSLFVTEYFSSAQSNQCFLWGSFFDLCQRFLMANCKTKSKTRERKSWHCVKFILSLQHRTTEENWVNPHFKKPCDMIQRNREMTYPDAIADFHQDVSLGRIPLIHAAASNEHNCTRRMMN